MKCAECNLYWKAEWEDFPSCKADPNWPAPCEYEEDDYEEEYMRGVHPLHAGNHGRCGLL